ncbi:MAG TPA: hypothetical protein VEQ86_06320, partial [Xanthobacteraceae bacterium]|nr:hypothetical protein [Xanthobacteraceae bacterium]
MSVNNLAQQRFPDFRPGSSREARWFVLLAAPSQVRLDCKNERAKSVGGTGAISIRMRSGRCFAVLRLRDLIVGTRKHIADDLAIIRLVLHHQNALAHAALRRRDFIKGISVWTALPRAARAEPREQKRRVAVLMGGLFSNDSGGQAEAAALEAGLTELGWKVGS